MKNWCLILLFTLVLTGCAIKNSSVQRIDYSHRQTQASESEAAGIPFEFQVIPEEFELSISVNGDTLPISNPSEKRMVADFKEDKDKISWRYPEEQIAVSIKQAKDYLTVTIISETMADNSFTWPNISAKDYYLPFGEGKRVPANDIAWQEYLRGQEFFALEQMSMPFWISSIGDYAVLFIMENPYRSQLQFSKDSNVSFSVLHEYPKIDENKTNSFRIYITKNNPVYGAKIYRDFVIEKGNFLRLEQKQKDNPNIQKLYGAPFIYLWYDFIVSEKDINWSAFRNAISTPTMKYLLSFADKQETGSEFISILEQIKGQDYISIYQKNIICNYISNLLKRDDFWNPAVFNENTEISETILAKGYENLNKMEKIQVNKYALAVSLPQVFSDVNKWMDTNTVDLLYDLKESGIDRAWIGLNNWEQAYGKPELVKTASDQGYLIASYDSYHSIHEPGKEQWNTAQFRDVSLYEKAAIRNRDGKEVLGFQNIGRKLNPVLSLPSVRERMQSIMESQLPFNSWFIDCDATGEIYDDYTPEHITTQEQDLAARLERMAYIRDTYNMVIGSEGGHDFAASIIAFAHGIELKSFSWMDGDMKSNQDSEFYIGRYYNPNGGVAEHFSKRIPLKDKYNTIFVNPKYDIPLFKLVYNDSLITSYHWDWSTFKIQGATKERMMREVLYNVSPLYHLDAVEWNKYKDDIIRHNAVWSAFSRKVITQEMTDFKYLMEDGSVQMTQYGKNIYVIANFNDVSYWYKQHEIPKMSVFLEIDGNISIYTPETAPENQ